MRVERIGMRVPNVRRENQVRLDRGVLYGGPTAKRAVVYEFCKVHRLEYNEK